MNKKSKIWKDTAKMLMRGIKRKTRKNAFAGAYWSALPVTLCAVLLKAT